MFKNYFLTAWRNLLRNKFYTSINVAGLAIGLSVGILILLWVQDELSYDTFHANAENIYKLNSHLGAGSDEQVWEGAPSPVALMAAKVPEVERAVRVTENWDNSLFESGGKKLIGSQMLYVDPAFFDVFDFKLIRGEKKKLFKDSHSIILTRSVAENFFGKEDPVGKILVADKKDNFTVTAVLEDFPENSTLKGKMIFPMALFAERFRGNGDWKTIDEDLGNYFYRIFIQLKPGASSDVAAAKISKIYADKRNQKLSDGNFSLQAFTDLHLYAPDGNASAMQTVRTFLLVAVLILIIACINYVNLSTARSILRSKEVSVRKIIGAERRQLFIQFVCESALLFAVSAVLAFGIIRLLLPLYNELSGKELIFDLGNSRIWLILGSAIFGSLLLASVYPAILLSSFNPIQSLKGKISGGMGNNGFRKTLVVTQFVFSIALIISTIIIGLQLKFIREKDLGYNKEHVFSFSARGEMFIHMDAIKSQLLKVTGVKAVSSGSSNIVGDVNTTGDTDWEGKGAGRMFLIHPYGIDENYIPLFNIKIADGKNFTGSKADSAYVILNETAVREAGITNPIGKRFTLFETSGTIIGVVKDFNYASLKQRIEPAIFYYQSAGSRLSVKTSGKEAGKAIEEAKNIWMTYNADYPFEYSFTDEDYDRMYKTEQRTGILFNVFALVAITISCLGLFGLSTYTAQVKKREVGIRKVLGASLANITSLLAEDFLKLIFISLLIAVPVAWWTMNKWLQDYVYRITISWWIFVAAGVVTIFIALMTVGFQAVKSGLANPVNSLKEQ